jgi:hypothetical protein
MNAEEKRTELGILAIMYLQAFAGVLWDRDRALAAWHRFSADEQEKTLRAYRALLGNGKLQERVRRHLDARDGHVVATE